MDKFTISQLEQLSGVKAHTLRMWESRYNALVPNRTEGNIRFYSGEQLSRLLNITALQKSGYKIAQLGICSNKQLEKLMQENFLDSNNNVDDFVSIRNQIIASSATYNEKAFNLYFDKCVKNYGLLDTYKLIIYPLLQQVGLLWCSKQLPVSQEHFLSHLIHKKIYAAIEKLPHTNNPKSVWLLFLPEDEVHLLGLLISAYLLQSSGNKVIFLGANTPQSVVYEVTERIAINNILFFKVLDCSPEIMNNYVLEIKKRCKKQKIYIAAKTEMLNSIAADVIKLYFIKDLEKNLT